jgi:hypothetical protein
MLQEGPNGSHGWLTPTDDMEQVAKLVDGFTTVHSDGSIMVTFVLPNGTYITIGEVNGSVGVWLMRSTVGDDTGGVREVAPLERSTSEG